MCASPRCDILLIEHFFTIKTHFHKIPEILSAFHWNIYILSVAIYVKAILSNVCHILDRYWMGFIGKIVRWLISSEIAHNIWLDWIFSKLFFRRNIWNWIETIETENGKWKFYAENGFLYEKWIFIEKNGNFIGKMKFHRNQSKFIRINLKFNRKTRLKMHICTTYRAIITWVRVEHHVYHVSAVARFPDWFAFALWPPQTGSTPLFISSYLILTQKNIIEITNTDR